ncbi:MAG: IPT/TIG domain-containing protein [Deltaproteobacteria bacterium]|nr:IPT/TIG domain-containing protein [Deltaproteobacteria bacterium]
MTTLPSARTSHPALHLLCLLAALATAAPAAAQAPVSVLPAAARTEPRAFGGAGVTRDTPILAFQYVINLDNTGVTSQRSPADGCSPGSPGYPASCLWTSIAGVPGSSPIVAQGDQADFAGLGLTLPPGRYLVSVRADGYKLDGAHFTVPAGSGVPIAVPVPMQPTPLPTATIQAAVFEDISPVNGAPDVPAERGLAGFQGHITDYIDFVTTDVFGNPLCTEYERDALGNVILVPPDYSPTPIAGTGGICLSKCYVVSGAVDVGTVAPSGPGGRCPADGTGLTMENGQPVPAGAAIHGKLEIPNLGPNRYALSVVPPGGTHWAQTTTLEGNLDWDAWVMEGATGLDTEFVVAGEPFPTPFFGYVETFPPTQVPQERRSAGFAGAGTITGVVESVKVYVPAKGGLALPGGIWGGLAGARLEAPVPYAWVTLTDLGAGDTLAWVGRADQNGRFTIGQVPDGSYTLTWFDQDLNYLLDLVNVTVANGETVDLGILPLAGWWTKIDGYVFNDLNRNGKRDPGEPGIAGFPVVMKKRENSVMDRGATLVTTDASGYYSLKNAYPMTQWLVVEAYADAFYTTGVTWQADNQPTETTLLGAGVDVSVLPIIGLGGRLDWGVHAYDAQGTSGGLDPRHGGIVGTVSYDTTRNELDPRYAAVEDWQPGIPNLWIYLWAPVPCGTTADACDATGRYELEPAGGAFKRGTLLNAYLTETWQRPTGCVARDVNGTPLVHGVDEQVLPLDAGAECLEGPLMGVQFQNGFSTVDGNYGFGDVCQAGIQLDGATGLPVLDADGIPVCADGAPHAAMTSGDYLVEVTVPSDPVTGRPLYKVTREEDINIFTGDQYVPQVPPPDCAGPLHIVDVEGVGADGYPATSIELADVNGLPASVSVPASTPTHNPDFAGGGGSPFEGQARPLCSTKLVRVSYGRSIAPTFNYFTDVPIPGRFWGLIVDDLNFSADPKSLLYGEKGGVPFAPVGIYDWANRLVTTVESDYNGLFDVLVPSTNRISCPTPSGVCANLYRMVGNDPGIPGRLNPNYNPQFRTISAEFEAFPGLLVPADLAPTQVGVTVQLPGGLATPVTCALDATTPQLLRVSVPYVYGTGATRSVTITGTGFGAARGTGTVTLDGTALAASAYTSWTDTQITLAIPGSVAVGPHQLQIAGANGKRSVNGITLHVVGSGYNPRIFRVQAPGGPPPPPVPASSPATVYTTVQAGIDAAAAFAADPRGNLVVVFPGVPDPDPRVNPRGAYYENLVVSFPLKLQGVGPGGFQGTTYVPGSILDGSAFGGDTDLATAWRTRVGSLLGTWDGNQTVYEGQVIYLLGSAGQYAAAHARTPTGRYRAAIDGFDIRGGDQQGFPANINQIGGTPTGLPPNVITQGGGIFANAWIDNLQIANNVLQNNGGAYGGAIRLGTPNLQNPGVANHNTGVRIAWNRILANAGTNLAGGVGIFAGSDGYEVAHNDICGNFSAEYGGGLSAVGLSPGGDIHHNRIYFNRSYDEAGGVMIAGELPADPQALSPGSGPVAIHENLIQANLANDDGGGLRFLMAGRAPMNVYNNFIVNNVSTHEGGGVSLNDTSDVRFFNNTVMKNITTATAITSTGIPAPAGLSTGANSVMLQAAGGGAFSNPLLFNNVFWDNRAGSRVGNGSVGIGAAGDATPINYWDMGTADGSGVLSPTSSILQVTTGTVPDASNGSADPQVVSTYDTSVSFAPWRNNPAFLGAILVAVELPPELLGNYHLSGTTSPAYNTGAASKTVGALTVSAPAIDVDDNPRPQGSPAAFDMGADEIGTGTGGGGGPALPALALLDAFNRANATSLGGNWQQPVIGGAACARVNANQAFLVNTGLAGLLCSGGGGAAWNGAAGGGPVFGAKQGAALTLSNAAALSGGALYLKQSGSLLLGTYASAIRVRYQAGTGVVVATTTNYGVTYSTRGTLGATFAAGDRLTALVDPAGTLWAWQTSAGATTLIGSVQLPTTGAEAFTAGPGRIGLFLPSGGRADNFSGGTVP